jgi:hypothetical protein
MTKQTKLFLGLIIAGAIIFAGHNLITREKEVPRPPLMPKEGLYQLGGVIVDTIGGEIRFDAEVQKREGWVQHLIYLHGYRWLKEESAITADVRLADLQKAISLLDWKLWDELWHRQNAKCKMQNAKLVVFVKWDRRKIPAQKLVLADDKLEIGDFIFLGSPYFDHIVFDKPPDVDCRLCPMFPLEQKALRELFIRESDQSGYELNSEGMPSQGTEVTVIIQISKIQ